MTEEELDAMAQWYATDAEVRRADRFARRQDDVDDSMTRCLRDWLRVSPMAVVTGFAVTVGLAVGVCVTLAVGGVLS